MSISALTEKTIRLCSSVEAFERGYTYYQQGAVLSLIKRGAVIQATVQGSEVQPYTVRCILDTGNTVTAWCSCPYIAGGWCKHIVAALRGNQSSKKP